MDADVQLAIRAVLQRARELSLETDSQEEFLAAFAAPGACGRCGKVGLDREGYTDCQFVQNGAGQELLCADCLAVDRPSSLMPGRSGLPRRR
jgi:hypothetical protein